MQTIHLDFQSQGVPPVVPVMQSDSRSRFLGIVLYNGGVPYEAPTGASYEVQYRSASVSDSYSTIKDEKNASRSAVTADADNPNIVTVELAEEVLHTLGDVQVILCVLADGGYQLSTFPIIVRVIGLCCPDTPQGNSGSGLTAAEKQLLLTLFQNAAYTNDNTKQTYDALATLWDKEV